MTTKKTNEPTGPSNEHSSPVTDGGTTTFADDAATAALSTGVDSLRLGIVDGTKITGSTSLADFFKKPTRIATGVLSTADATRIPAVPWQIDQLLLSNASKSPKFSGNLLWRATIVLKLQANASRFQTGRYILAWMPTCGTLFTDAGAQALYRMHSCNLMQITQLPHVEIDLAKETSVELRIPFMSMYPFHDIKSTGSSMGLGAAFIFPYMKLSAGSGNTTCPYVVWAHFEDVVLSGPTVAQSSQPGIMGSINVAQPLPSDKKRAQTENVRYHRSNVPYAASTDMHSLSNSLALTQNNNIAMSVGQGDGLSVTSIDYIKSRYAYFTGFVWSATSTVDTQLFAQNHNPLITATYGKGTTYTPVGFLMSNFKLWRGSLKFRFKLVKNEFYSGRLGVMYIPTFRQSAVPVQKSGATEYAFREIVDIRDTSEFEVQVPYISPEVFTSSTDNVGWLVVDVIDPLVAPSSVDQNITVLVEVAGGDDLQFQYPMPIDRRPYAPITVQSGKLEETMTPLLDFGVPSNARNPLLPYATTGEEVGDLKLLIKRFCANPGPKLAATSTPTVPETIFPFLLNIASQSATIPNPLFKDSYKSDLLTRFSLCYGMTSGSVRVIIEPWEEDTDDVLELGMDYDSAVVPASVVGFFTYEVNPNALRIPVSTRVDGLYDVTVPAYSRVLARSTAAQIICSTDTGLRPSLSKNSKMTFLSVQNVTTTSTVARAYQFHRMGGDDFNCHVWLGTIPMVLESAT